MFEGMYAISRSKRSTFEITGSFVHDPNPLVEANLHQLKEAMKKIQARPRRLLRRRRRPLHVHVDEKEQTIGCDILTAVMARKTF